MSSDSKGKMPAADAPIPAGRPHQTVAEVEARVYDYDSLGVKAKRLPAGTRFQPWEPGEHGGGAEVPITLGDGAAAFDWGVRSLEGHFLRREDFFALCEPCDEGEPEAEAAAVCWRMADGRYLLAGAAVPLPTGAPDAIRLPHGEEIQSATPYTVVTADGSVSAVYPAPRSYSLEDVLYVYDLYRVVGARLYRYLWHEQYGYDARIEAEVVALPALTPCDPAELPFDIAP